MPHVARRSTVRQLVTEIAKNIRSIEAGGPLRQPVDTALGYDRGRDWSPTRVLGAPNRNFVGERVKRRKAMRLAGKVAIISGAASGMGAATARIFAREGVKVVIADVLEREGRQLADAIGAAARFELLDVTKEEDWAAVVAATTRHFGKLDVLVNNAGISGSAEQDFYSTEAWHRIMAVNATGVFFGLKYAIPAMISNGGGSIVNLSSIAGIIGSEHVHMAYNASKAAVRLMTKSVAVQHAKDKIRANSVHPGVMPPMRTSGRTADPAVRAERMRVIPMGRPGEVEEVAYAILFLASDEASYITGSEIHVDGGAIAI
jgi:NAD(P)-dependent dehydrogenase (short-subunit alcohol dehydrogenase family)